MRDDQFRDDQFKIEDIADVRFDARGLVANAGLVLPATLGERLGLTRTAGDGAADLTHVPDRESVMEVDSSNYFDGDDQSRDPIHDTAEWRPPSCIGNVVSCLGNPDAIAGTGNR